MAKGISQEALEHVVGADGKVEIELTTYNLLFTQVMALHQIREIVEREIGTQPEKCLMYYINAKEIADIFGIMPEKEEE